jgi:carbonic anhydrase
MRLFEAIIDANHRALAGDQSAGLHPAEFAAELPIIALTCIDPRLNPLLPQVLGVPPEDFIWLRNAGNVITGPLSSTMRSLALACAIKGGKEIAIIGHTDCQVGKTTTSELIEKLRALGIERHLLPDNLSDYFGTFASPRGNVLKAVEIVRHSPLIGAKIPVQGLLVDTDTGKLEWLVNGYQALETTAVRPHESIGTPGQAIDSLKSLADFKIGEMKFPETKIGEAAGKVEDWLAKRLHDFEPKIGPPPTPAPAPQAAAPPKMRIPLPPPIRPSVQLRRRPK